jgi:tetratricopeptide (TPR) repeat protein
MTNWTWEHEKISLDSLFQKESSFCFLAGSGISIDSPSNLPCGYHFTRSVIEDLMPRSKIEEILQFCDSERYNMQIQGEFLRFEKLMDYVSEFDPDLHLLDFYGNCTSPNLIHYFLAHMATRKNTVTTTNFDSLIEIALTKIGINKDQIHPLIHPSDYESVNSTDRLSPNKFNIYKLHGSLNDIRTGLDSRSSLQATISQIADSTGTYFKLPKFKLTPFSTILETHDLIVLGYSGLDDFDIFPTIQNIKSSKKIIWITHKNDIHASEAQIQILKESDQNISMDRTGLNLLSLERSPENLFRVYVNTADLVKWLWNRYLPLNAPQLLDTGEKLTLKKYKIPEVSKWNLCGSIFFDLNYMNQANDTLVSALELARKEKDIPHQIRILQNLVKVEFRKHGSGHLAALKTDLIKDYLRESLKLAKENQLHYLEMQHYFLAGELDEPRWLDTAEYNYLDGIKLAKKLNDNYHILYGNICLARINRKRFQWWDGDNYLDEVYFKSDEIDFKLQILSSNERACIDAGTGDFEGSIFEFKETLKIIDKVGDLQKWFEVSWNMATLYEYAGLYSKAVEIYKDLLDFVKKNMDLLRIGKDKEIEGIIQEIANQPDAPIDWDEYCDLLDGEKPGFVDPLFFPY